MTRPRPDRAFVGEVEAVMSAAHLLVGVLAASVAQVGDVVTLPQLRVLVMVSNRSPLNLGAVADGLGVHPSNATRACDRLVAEELLDRREAAEDRRQLALTLTPKGRRLVDSVMSHRRVAIAQVLRRMSDRERHRVAAAFEVFAGAAGEPSSDADRPLWF